MLMVYVYDDTFEGLLTAIFEARSRGEKPVFIHSEKNLQYNLLHEYVYISTDREKSDRVYRAIYSRISVEAVQHVYHTYLSGEPDAGTMIFNYLELGWKAGNKVDLHLSDDRVLKIHTLSSKVDHEVHKMMGFVRFRLMGGGIYYAPVKPDYNIIELLAPHFAGRLSDQYWIIHDTGRELAVLYNKKTWIISEFSCGALPETSQEESEYQQLWKEFFKTTAIPSRENLKLQRQLMPKRYWQYLTEMN